MDKYTEDARAWLDQRFRATDEDGIYVGHQPIYGFRDEHCERGYVARFIITHQIMRALSHLHFRSFLDVGGGEGYKAALVRSIFSADVRSSDLSEEACKRVKEIFGIDGEPVDIHHLPYQDGEFDVVLCSETLEHVFDVEGATRELLRVCRNALVITVPHESEAVVEKNIRQEIPHAHIHSFNTRSFDFILPSVHRVVVGRMNSRILNIPSVLVEAMRSGKVDNYPSLLVDAYNLLLPVFRLLFGKRAARMLIHMDGFIANRLHSYSGLIFVVLKDEGCYSEPPRKHISISQLMDFRVPYHRLT